MYARKGMRRESHLHKIRPYQRKKPGEMNGIETQYAQRLEDMKRAGGIVDYRYESLKLKLAPNTFITLDFLVTYETHMAFHEVKGFWEEDARAKIKIAAAMFPEFQFVGVTLEKREEDKKVRGASKYWTFEEFKAVS